MNYTSPRFGNYEFRFGRINVLLGANGTGKSKVLAEIRDWIAKAGGTKPVFIEGGRTIKLEDVLKLDAKNFQQYDRLESAIAQYERKRAKSLADRVFDALVVLEKRELQLKARHSDEVEVWAVGARSSDYPKRPPAPLGRLFELFTEISPQIVLTFDYEARRLSANKGGHPQI